MTYSIVHAYVVCLLYPSALLLNHSRYVIYLLYPFPGCLYSTTLCDIPALLVLWLGLSYNFYDTLNLRVSWLALSFKSVYFTCCGHPLAGYPWPSCLVDHTDQHHRHQYQTDRSGNRVSRQKCEQWHHNHTACKKPEQYWIFQIS